MNKKVFREDLNLAIVLITLISKGREFHISGALTEKALLPNLHLLILTDRRCFDSDLSLLTGWYEVSKLLRYLGAVPFKHL